MRLLLPSPRLDAHDPDRSEDMIVETTDPGIERVREAVRRYLEEYPDFAGPLELYGAVMEIQQDALSRVACEMEMSSE